MLLRCCSTPIPRLLIFKEDLNGFNEDKLIEIFPIQDVNSQFFIYLKNQNDMVEPECISIRFIECGKYEKQRLNRDFYFTVSPNERECQRVYDNSDIEIFKENHNRYVKEYVILDGKYNIRYTKEDEWKNFRKEDEIWI